MVRQLKENHDVKVGVISDTHGLVRPVVFDVFKGVDMIVHAGDMGSQNVISDLQSIANVVTVKGNVDHGEWVQKIPGTDAVKICDSYLYVLHDLGKLDLDPVAGGFNAIISGHSHRPVVKIIDNTLYLNPGSAGPKRFKLPISVALLYVKGSSVDAEIVKL